MAKQQITVPDIGGAEAEVIELLVAVGDDVAQEQGLIVLESDKASMEIPSTAAGVIVELLVSEGQQVAEGAPLAVIETADETTAESESSDDARAAAAQPEPEDAPVEPAPEAPAPKDVPAETAVRRVVIPDIGTDDAVELIEVCVQVGDTVAEGDSLVVLESDKASMEVPAPFGGEVTEILVAEGSSVRQGDDLLDLQADSAAEQGAPEPERPASERPAPGQSTSASPAAEPESKPQSTGQSAGQATGQATPQAKSVSEPEAAQSMGEDREQAGVYAGPAVRKLAREFGIVLSEVSGTGPRGRLVKEDLHRFVQQRLSQPAAPATAGAGIPAIPEMDFSAFGDVETTQRSKLDKLTATNMQRSWLNVPHVTQYDDADITELEAFRGSMKAEAEQRGIKLTPMPFILKACAVALRDNPKFCTSLADGGESLVHKQYIHIGMAVDTPAGLLVPVIRDVDQKSIWELAEEVLQMAAGARDRKLKPRDMQGGCFTISSLGNIGGKGFTPIVNAPEVGILGVSRAEMKPVWDGQDFVPRKMLPLSLSYDHRVINGGDGGRFLTGLAALLGDIRKLLM